jgi:hypothetical protein
MGVHGHTQGIGDRTGRGIGTALLEAVEHEAREAGALGMAAWGLAVPLWMRASWFKKHGYVRVDRQGLATLVFKPFTDRAQPPAWPAEAHSPELADGDGVTVTCFDGGWCTLQNANCERARRAAAAEGARFESIDTSDPAAAALWGQDYGIWVDHRAIGTGPPLSEDAVRRRVRARQRGPWWTRLRSR